MEEFMDLIKDVYYSKDYVSLYLRSGDSIFDFKYEKDGEVFYNISIKRPIKSVAGLDIKDGFYDLETAYGYGGYYTNSNNKDFILSAMEEYKNRCLEEKIVAEFIRFHPFNNFPVKFGDVLDMNLYDRDVVYIDLSLTKDERWSNYSRKLRNELRKSSRELEFKRSYDIREFTSLYKETMKKNCAGSFYFFDKKYFEEIMKNDKFQLYKVEKDGKIIFGSLFIFSDDFVHCHLSASDYEMRKCRAGSFVLDAAFDIARENNKKCFLLGGGSTNSADNGLFKYKKKFSPFTKPFYISGNIYNREVYSEYNRLWERNSNRDVKYFLKYRLEV
ncbi:MAG: hypothetical protein CR982_09905 [Candidatus Cloacimonadota bacterium]|nr:MAG: hypothetical protein CR982_09905 [Candidatus Cloacimonadota bacterium]PIE78721.1 MAG: hypothetical protein CSA15_06245 [Candidatus Delongbacteria bacterium]